MFERLRVLYASGRLTVSQLNVAVMRGWITAEQSVEIVGPHG